MYSNILVPVDGSATSDKALEEAVRLAKQTGGRLRLLHIVDPLPHVSGYLTTEAFLSELQPALMRAGQEVLDKAKQSIQDSGVEVDTQLLETSGGSIAETIVEHAQSSNADVIVLGTHGRRGFERVMMGSDAEQVVRLAPVPVLLIRHR